MKRNVAIVLGLVGTAGLGACGRSDVLYKDDQYGAHGTNGGAGGGGTVNQTGGTGFTGGTGGGTGGSHVTGGTGGTGGSSTGGSGGGPRGGTGGGFGFGGSTIGGTGGSSGSGPAAGASGQGAVACAHTLPTCDTFTNFSTDAGQTWGISSFSGGIAVFGGTLTRDSVEDHVHVTGAVDGPGEGISIYFSTCADLSKYAGVYFMLIGTTGDNDAIEITPLTNSDYARQSTPASMLGACNPFADCVAPDLFATTFGSRQYAYWSDFSGGSPVVWNATTSPTEILGIEWIFPYDSTTGEYYVDVTLDDVGFIRSGSAAPDCGPPLGMGGIGGAAGMGGFGGTIAAGSGNLGGFAGAGAGGLAGSGGDSAGGFAGGGFSAGGFSSGGISSGGDASGGVSTGGESTGGLSSGGISSGGDASGGVATGGLSGSGS